jgi:hypothetical protein
MSDWQERKSVTRRGPSDFGPVTRVTVTMGPWFIRSLDWIVKKVQKTDPKRNRMSILRAIMRLGIMEYRRLGALPPE